MHTFFYIFLILMTERRLYLSMLVCVTVDFVVIKKILKDYKESQFKLFSIYNYIKLIDLHSLDVKAEVILSLYVRKTEGKFSFCFIYILWAV